MMMGLKVLLKLVKSLAYETMKYWFITFVYEESGHPIAYEEVVTMREPVGLLVEKKSSIQGSTMSGRNYDWHIVFAMEVSEAVYLKHKDGKI